MYCVCMDREGNLSIMTDIERNNMVNVLFDLRSGIPNHVLKRFEDKESAEKYLSDLTNADNLLNDIL